LLARIVSAVERAQADRPQAEKLAERVAGCFLVAVLLGAVAVAVTWWMIDPSRWLAVTVSVLVATCPCALSLAMPAAFTAGAARLARAGLVSTRAGAIEVLAKASHVFLDKTGTLSTGRPTMVAQWTRSGMGAEDALELAAALERHSEHPLAKALVAATSAPSAARAVQGVANQPGAGLTGFIDGRQYWLGHGAYIGECCGVRAPDEGLAALGAASGARAWLADGDGVVAGFGFEDTLRDGAEILVQTLQRQGRTVGLLSGDAEAVVTRVGHTLGISDARGGLDPEGKRTAIAALQANGAVVAAVGDGVNDGPVLAAAQVSVAMGGGTALARRCGDWVLLNDNLAQLAEGFVVARRTMAVVRQNVTWAVLYNLTALPAAAAGLLSPWQAALGMSLSSALVVLNSSRLASLRGSSGGDAAGAGRRGLWRQGLWQPR
jgi:Cu2+-exporting ATPase